jgi:hypothetical protein
MIAGWNHIGVKRLPTAKPTSADMIAVWNHIGVKRLGCVMLCANNNSQQHTPQHNTTQQTHATHQHTQHNNAQQHNTQQLNLGAEDAKKKLRQLAPCQSDPKETASEITDYVHGTKKAFAAKLIYSEQKSVRTVATWLHHFRANLPKLTANEGIADAIATFPKFVAYELLEDEAFFPHLRHFASNYVEMQKAYPRCFAKQGHRPIINTLDAESKRIPYFWIRLRAFLDIQALIAETHFDRRYESADVSVFLEDTPLCECAKRVSAINAR